MVCNPPALSAAGRGGYITEGCTGYATNDGTLPGGGHQGVELGLG